MSDICVISSMTENAGNNSTATTTSITTEFFNTKKNEWTHTIGLNAPVPYGLSIAPIGSCVYILGGSDVVDKYPNKTKMCRLDLTTGSSLLLHI